MRIGLVTSAHAERPARPSVAKLAEYLSTVLRDVVITLPPLDIGTEPICLAPRTRPQVFCKAGEVSTDSAAAQGRDGSAWPAGQRTALLNISSIHGFIFRRLAQRLALPQALMAGLEDRRQQIINNTAPAGIDLGGHRHPRAKLHRRAIDIHRAAVERNSGDIRGRLRRARCGTRRLRRSRTGLLAHDIR